VAPDSTGFELELGDADLLSDEHGTVPLESESQSPQTAAAGIKSLGIRIPLRTVLYQGALRTT
jgi:hypothetical protein